MSEIGRSARRTVHHTATEPPRMAANAAARPAARMRATVFSTSVNGTANTVVIASSLRMTTAR